MAISRITTWNSGDVLTAAALNGEFSNITSGGVALVSPYTATMDANNKQTINFLMEKLSAVATAANAARLYYRTDNNLPEYDTGSAIRTIPNQSICGGRLTLSGASLLFSPLVHNLIPINGRYEVIPDAGVTLAIGAAAAATLYYIYAYMSGSTMTLEFSATGYSTQAGTGVPIKTGDATRTLVGLARSPAQPGALSAAAGGAGNVNAGTHSYRVTFVGPSSVEYNAGTASAQVTAAGGGSSINLTAIPIGGSTVVSRKIYRTVAGDTGNYLLQQTVANNTATTATDNTADSGLGAAAPGTAVWQADAGLMGVLSFWNRRLIGFSNNFTAARTSTTSAPTWAEVNIEIRGNFLTWADEAVMASIQGTNQNSNASQSTITSVGFDGTTSEAAAVTFLIATAGVQFPIGLTVYKSGLAEGFHYATLLGSVSANTGTWLGGAAGGTAGTLPTFLSLGIRG